MGKYAKKKDLKTKLEPFRSPHITYDLSIYKKKKRQELKVRKMKANDINLTYEGLPMSMNQLKKDNEEDDDDDDDDDDDEENDNNKNENNQFKP